MTKKTTILVIVTSVMMVVVPTLYYSFDKKGKKYVTVGSSEAYSEFESEKDIAKALKKKNKNLYLHLFKKSAPPARQGTIYTYYTVSAAPDQNSFYTYILEKEDGFSLHIVAGCTSPKGVFPDHFNFSFDEDITEYYPTSTFIRDHTTSGIIEKSDITVTYPEEIILAKILNSNVTKIRFIGVNGVIEMRLSKEDKHAIQRTLTIYNELK